MKWLFFSQVWSTIISYLTIVDHKRKITTNKPPITKTFNGLYLGQKVITTLQFEEQGLYAKFPTKQGIIVLINNLPDISGEICTVRTDDGRYETLNCQWLMPFEERQHILKQIEEIQKNLNYET